MVKTDPTEVRPVLRQYRAELESTSDRIAVEVPVALIYNGISHAVMMASPENLEDFALGFSLGEGIIESPSELYETEIIPSVSGIKIQIGISARRFQALKHKRRFLTGQTGCGICGSESLQQIYDLPDPVGKKISVSSAAISKAMQQLPELQPLNNMTGAVHAAAWADIDGNVVQIREDIGRHNALDKLIGALSASDTPDGFLLMTSRASYEIIAKAARANINIIAAISAPTSLAVDIAAQLNITLLGFARNERFVIYTEQAGIKNLPEES
ncbi:formate dehydrogenase accessory sulfurtransferase FdhD [Endozoicomonadaceae bacterium StTr2]